MPAQYAFLVVPPKQVVNGVTAGADEVDVTADAVRDEPAERVLAARAVNAVAGVQRRKQLEVEVEKTRVEPFRE